MLKTLQPWVKLVLYLRILQVAKQMAAAGLLEQMLSGLVPQEAFSKNAKLHRVGPTCTPMQEAYDASATVTAGVGL